MAFLDILTRHLPDRKYMYRANHACLQAQSDPDYCHWTLADEERRGWQHAARLLAEVAPKLRSEYVLILDDDDLMINADGICLLKEAARDTEPAAVVFRGWHGDLGILPGPNGWMRRPFMGGIGSFDFIVRRDVFLEVVQESVNGGYCNDFAIIDGVFERNLPVVWLDALICAVMKRSRGK
jgi:hypothetical protein